MRILQLGITEVAGVPSRMARALTAQGIEARSVAYRAVFFVNDVVSPSDDELVALVDDSDLVHVHCLNTFRVHHRIITRKPFLIHIHGYPDWDKPSPPGLPHVVATPDLLQHFPAAAYLPTMLVLDELPGSPALGQGPLRVWKSPTLHDKSTEFFTNIMEAITRRWPDRVEYVHPTNLMSHTSIKQLRGSCHISLDQFIVQGYIRSFGLESLESLTQGLIAVNGVSDENLDIVARATGARPPFVKADTAQELGQKILSLIHTAITEPDRIETQRSLGPQYMREHWSESSLLPQWRALYEYTLSRRTWPMDGSARYWTDR